MAVIGSTVPTLVDIVKLMDPKGNLAMVAEILNQTNEVIQDIPWMEGNLPIGHRTTLRTSLPTVYFRRFNEGVLPSKGTTGQVDEVCAMMSAWSEIDVKLLELNGWKSAFRNAQEKPFIEAMGVSFVSTLFYGNMGTDPKSFTGLATRFNDLNLGESASTLKDGAVVDAGGSGSDMTSIWLIGWGENTVHGIYPKGMTAGLQNSDKGIDRKTDSNGGIYEVARTNFTWDCGIAVPDWRYVIRIANIDDSALIAESGNADLIKKMIFALDRRPSGGSANWAFYTNRRVRTMLRVQALAKASNTITLETIGGIEMTRFLGVPIRMVDQLLISETALT